MTSQVPIRLRWLPIASARERSRVRGAVLAAVVLVGVGAGCGAATPSTAPQSLKPGLASTAPPGTALQCAPLAGDSTTVLIGPAGGAVAVGRQVLDVPQGALNEAVAITGVMRPDTVNVVRFEPEGLVFTKAATLTMYYGNCEADARGPRPRIALVDDRLKVLSYIQLPKGKGPNPPYVWGKLMHFSNYAVAW